MLKVMYFLFNKMMFTKSLMNLANVGRLGELDSVEYSTLVLSYSLYLIVFQYDLFAYILRETTMIIDAAFGNPLCLSL